MTIVVFAKFKLLLCPFYKVGFLSVFSRFSPRNGLESLVSREKLKYEKFATYSVKEHVWESDNEIVESKMILFFKIRAAGTNISLSMKLYRENNKY